MANHPPSRRPAAPAASLFEALPVASAASAPAPESADIALLNQCRRQALVAYLVQRDITRFQQSLARPLASWQEREDQVIEVNASLALLVASLAEFLPADLRPLVARFLDLRASLLLRKVEG